MMKIKDNKKHSKIYSYIIIVLMVLFAVILIFNNIGFRGLRMFVVKSGSMEPEIHTGSLIITKKESKYNTGDIITFYSNINSGETITHRVVSIDESAGLDYLSTKGDANDVLDSRQIAEDQVVGRSIFTLPLLGYLVAFLKKPIGVMLFIVIPATIIIYDEIKNIKTEILKIKQAKIAVVNETKELKKEVIKEERKLIRLLKRLLNKTI